MRNPIKKAPASEHAGIYIYMYVFIQISKEMERDRQTDAGCELRT